MPHAWIQAPRNSIPNKLPLSQRLHTDRAQHLSDSNGNGRHILRVRPTIDSRRSPSATTRSTTAATSFAGSDPVAEFSKVIVLQSNKSRCGAIHRASLDGRTRHLRNQLGISEHSVGRDDLGPLIFRCVGRPPRSAVVDVLPASDPYGPLIFARPRWPVRSARHAALPRTRGD